MARIAPLDPDALAKGRMYRQSERFAQTRPGRWLAIHLAPRLDPLLLKLTGGRTGSFPEAKVVLLTVVGRRSGEPRTAPLLYFTEGDDVILLASSYGRERHPAWYLNACANPEVELRQGRDGGRYRAADVVDEAERRRLYDRAQGIFTGYGGYERRAAVVGRTIPVLRLTPLD
ncbi:MAG TPA: nitroreductase/quinone reductase family protein [Baekduia sp.]|jgi:deazaflavin-dependent oxidoreductase (nitroreductase family)